MSDASLPRLLTGAVRQATGNVDAEPRPGQDKLAQDIDRVFKSSGNHLIGKAPTGVGKALAVDTPILTTGGWSTMGHLATGDEVFDPDGNPARVVTTSTVWQGRDCYDVVLSDGSNVVCDAEHLWPTWTRDGLGQECPWAGQMDALLTARDQAREQISVGGLVTVPGLARVLDGIVPAGRIARMAGQLGLAGTDPGHVVLAVADVLIEQAAAGMGTFEVVTCEFLADEVADGRARYITTGHLPADLATGGGVEQVRRVVSVLPVRSRPVRCISVDTPSHLFLAGEGLVPTHNSLSYLVPAARLALSGGRTVVATESLGLQHQITDKDFPVVAQTVKETTGEQLQVAVHKGWNNYACLLKAAGQAGEISGQVVDPATLDRDGLDDLSQQVAADPVVSWALSADNGDGDRAGYPHQLDEDQWERVSVSTDECHGKSCPLVDLCFPTRARHEVADADVVVTNHSMLAVQATKNVPVIIGSKHVGEVDAVVVDEAHALPATVRGMGSVEVSERRILTAVRTLTRVLPDSDPEVERLAGLGRNYAAAVGQHIVSVAAQVGGEGVKIPDDVDPLPMGEDVAAWCKKVASVIVDSAAKSTLADRLQARRDGLRVERVGQDVDQVRRGEVGVARWVQLPDGDKPGPGGVVAPTIHSSPVDIAATMGNRVWTTDADPHEHDDTQAGDGVGGDGGGDRPARRELPVVAVSATVPSSFGIDAGLRADVGEYESPFAGAYESSLLYVPRAQVGGVSVPVRSFGSRQSLDTGDHPVWAGQLMEQLVESAGGRAIVLAATATAGRHYAHVLRAHARGRWAVHSQWDGRGKQVTTQQWREDETSVLVGTRSYMTGVDAPGATCSLVIVDRVPRGPANVVDDERVAVLAQSMNEFRARDLVYAVDAAQLLEQATGRLIRSTQDRGVVAVLDPRLLKRQPVSYPAPTRRIYMDALGHFTSKTARMSTTRDFLARLIGTTAVDEAA